MLLDGVRSMEYIVVTRMRNLGPGLLPDLLTDRSLKTWMAE